MSKDTEGHGSVLLGSTSAILSPDGSRVAVHLDRDTDGVISDDYGLGYVYVLDRKTLTAVLLTTYISGAGILWSPEGNHLAFDDKEYSNSGLCYVFTLDAGDGILTSHETNVSDLFMKTDHAKELRRMSHQYISAKRWADENTLILDVHGHAAIDDKEPDWFDWCFMFDLETETFTDITAEEALRQENPNPVNSEEETR